MEYSKKFELLSGHQSGITKALLEGKFYEGNEVGNLTCAMLAKSERVKIDNGVGTDD